MNMLHHTLRLKKYGPGIIMAFVFVAVITCIVLLIGYAMTKANHDYNTIKGEVSRLSVNPALRPLTTDCKNIKDQASCTVTYRGELSDIFSELQRSKYTALKSTYMQNTKELYQADARVFVTLTQAGNDNATVTATYTFDTTEPQ